MKKILLSLLGIITLGLINFSSASFTSVIYNQPIQQWNNISVSDIYNQYGEGFLCVSTQTQGLSVMFYNNSWSVINSIQITNNNGGMVCYLIDDSISSFNTNGGDAFYSYFIAGGSSQCPSEDELCPNIRLNIVNSNDNNQGTGLNLTNYSNDTRLVSNIYYSGNLQFSQNNGNLLMTCPSSDCAFYENELNRCLEEYDSLGQDYDSLQSSCDSIYSGFYSCQDELNVCSSSLSSCLSGGNSELSGNNWSALFINDIQHIGNSIIDITIPEEISWDYLNTGDIFEIDIEGYNVDTEYIDNIIRTQNYKPTSEDFTELVKMLAPYSKIIIFCVFLFIVWAWIKKPFKSKKL